MTLFDECIEALGKKCNILETLSTKKIFDEFENNFPMTSWGQIDWDKSKVLNQGAYSYEYFQQILDSFDNKEEYIFILWDEASLPAVESKLDLVFSVIDDVTAVSFNTWIYLRKENKVIEFYHDGNITVGETAD